MLGGAESINEEWEDTRGKNRHTFASTTRNVSIGVKRTTVSQSRIIGSGSASGHGAEKVAGQFEAKRLITGYLHAFDTSKRSAIYGGIADCPYLCRIRALESSGTREPCSRHCKKMEGIHGTRPTFPFSLKTPLHAPLA